MADGTPYSATVGSSSISNGGPVSAFHDLTMNSLAGEPVSFSDFADKVCLVVNVASY
jgi:hypothetical protein